MIGKKSAIVVLAAAVLSGNVAYASFGDAVVGGIVGGVVGSVITNEVYHGKRRHTTRKRYKKRKTRSKKRRVKRVVAPVMTSEKKIQKSLTALGFYHGKIDGEVNSYETRSAIKAMNNAYELGTTASLSPNAKDALIYLGDLFMLDRILIAKDNSRRGKAKKIQASLKVQGFYHDKIDGAIGSGTRRCISDYKSAKGLSSGSALDFEEEYQLISSAKTLNDKNIDDTLASLKGQNAQTNATKGSTTTGNSGTVILQPAN